MLCGSSVCRTLPGGSSGYAISGACLYQLSYGDGSYTQGVLALETFTFGDSTPMQGVGIGCIHHKRGLSSGLLDLGWGPMSLVGQLGGVWS